MSRLAVASSETTNDPAAGSDGPQALTVADSIESRRLLQFGSEDQAVRMSPDGKRYLVTLVRGDLKKNGNWIELVAGQSNSFDTADAAVVKTLFTTSKKDDGTGRLAPTHISHNRIVWLADNRRVAFLWNDGESATQVVAVDLVSGEVSPITRHATSVLRFGISGDGQHVVYWAFPPARAPNVKDGGAVTAVSVFSVLRGNFSGYEPWENLEMFAADAPDWLPHRIEHVRMAPDGRWPDFLSPDGRFALVVNQPSLALPGDWERYSYEPLRERLLRARQLRDGSSLIDQVYVVDTHERTYRSLWSAPNIGERQTQFLWSRNGRRLILGPAFMPPAIASEAGLAGEAFVEVDVATGAVWPLPFTGVAGHRYALKWTGDGDLLEIAGPAESRWFRSGAHGWQTATAPVQPLRSAHAEPGPDIRIDQDLNTPPSIIAVDRVSGRRRMLLDINPRLRGDFALGHVAIIQWKDESNRAWSGRLYYPTRHVARQRFPLVIQTHGYSPPTEFSLFGNDPGLSTTAFAAQALANRQFFVLQMPDIKDGQVTPDEPEIYRRGYESAIAFLHAQGLVDSRRVGLVGFSRTGWHVEYALIHSPLRYAAAVVADNIDASYLQAVLHGGTYRDEFESDNGSSSVGDGLSNWLRRAPGFNAHRVCTPLRLEVDSGGINFALTQWEMFSNLRFLRLPVELFIVPSIEHGDHPLQMPVQQLASQGGTVDWMDFWLNAREDKDPQKSAQYERWRALRALSLSQREYKCSN